MSTQKTQPDACEPSSDRPNVVIDMLDRPVADVANFCRQWLFTWLKGLIDPWKFGKSLTENDQSLAPPFAFLVTTLFLTGAAMRFYRAIEYMPISEDTSVFDDFRFSLGELSLMQVVLATLPCVLIVSAAGWLLGLIESESNSKNRRRTFHSTCYAIGWQFGCITVLMLLVVLLQLGGYEPSGSLNDEMNLVLPYVAGFVLIWGTLILAPQAANSLTNRIWWPLATSILLCFIVGSATLVGSLFTLRLGTDLNAAAKLRVQRQYDQFIGDLQINVLQTASAVEQAITGSNVEGDVPAKIVVAFTNRSDRVLVVPSQEILLSSEEWAHRIGNHQLRILDSSFDELSDRALIIKPDETRVATLVFETSETISGKSIKTHAGELPFRVAFYRRDPEGRFNEFHSVLWAPNRKRRLELAQQTIGNEIKNSETMTR